MRTSLILGFVVFAGCANVVGNGVLLTETRETGAFRRVSLNSGVHAKVTTGARAVGLKADQNLISLYETVVEGETLVVRAKDGSVTLPSKAVEVTVSNDLIEGVTASGGADVLTSATSVDEFVIGASGGSTVILSGLTSQRLVVDASGASKVTVAGTANSGTVNASGASTVDTRGVSLQSATLEVSGGSLVRAAVSQHLAGAASGGSSVVITGTPTGDIALSGASTLSRGGQ